MVSKSRNVWRRSAARHVSSKYFPFQFGMMTLISGMSDPWWGERPHQFTVPQPHQSSKRFSAIRESSTELNPKDPPKRRPTPPENEPFRCRKFDPAQTDKPTIGTFLAIRPDESVVAAS